MKIKSKFLITMILLCFVSVMAIAENSAVFSIKPIDENSFVLQLTSEKQEQIQVSIKDVAGALLYDRTFMQKELDQRFDLHELPLGKYSVIVSYDGMTKVQPIQKEHELLKIEVEDLQTIFKPTFRQHATYLDLDMLCLSNMKVAMRIMDSEGNVIHQELVRSITSLHKRFNLSLLKEGQYIISVEVVDRVLHQEFRELIDWSPNTLATL